MRQKPETFGTAAVYRTVGERGKYMKREVRNCLDLTVEVLTEALAAGKVVRYSGLGVFYPVVRKRRGKDATYITVRFRPARKMLSILNKTEGGR